MPYAAVGPLDVYHEVDHPVEQDVRVEPVVDAERRLLLGARYPGNEDEERGQMPHQEPACARACSRSSNFWILPVEVFGNGPNVT